MPLLFVSHMSKLFCFQMNGCIVLVCSVSFPYMVLLASGGHCILGIAEDVDKFYRLGETNDIAPGEALDKVSQIFVN